MNIWTIICLCFTLPAVCQPFPHAQAHAHNDYEHQRPLFDALENGFTSVEADVHLVDGVLAVSHDHPTGAARTLEILYLKPLDSIINRNGGWVYQGYHQPLRMMIDIKTDAKETFFALLKVLEKYKQHLHTPSHTGALIVVISGNRPIESIEHEKLRLTTIDGRPQDLDKAIPASLMPVISENYTKVTSTDASLDPSAEALDKVKELARRVHSENKKLRLWAIPDHDNAWEALLAAGVDIINTDRLPALHLFLTQKQR